MIDFTKIQIPDKCGNNLLQNKLLSFERNVNEDTGELDESEERTAEYKNMKFKIYPSGRIILMGSWHKFAKEGYNSSDFNLQDFRLAVFDFCRFFDLNPNELRLLQFEAGVNIVPPLQIRSVLRAFVCSSDGKVPFSQMRSRTGSSLGVEMYRSEYGIKVYDKSKQYKLLNELMRYEVKFTSSKIFRREFEVEYLSDLMLFCKWAKISKKVENSVKDLILNEPTFETSGMSSAKKNFIVQSSISAYWRELNRRQRMRSKIRMKKMVEQYARSDLKSDIQTRIREKLLQLTAIKRI
jgi:hypothetical protein